jgi:hypothetical protein
MTRPDDVPVDVALQANGAWHELVSANGRTEQETVIARAILAERQRCAAVAEELPRCELRSASPGVTVERSFKTGADAQARAIAAAILSPVTP